MNLGEAVEYYGVKEPKGEYVLVLEGASENTGEAVTVEQALEQVRRLVEMGDRPVDACKAVAKECGFRKSELYAALCSEDE